MVFKVGGHYKYATNPYAQRAHFVSTSRDIDSIKPTLAIVYGDALDVLIIKQDEHIGP